MKVRRIISYYILAHPVEFSTDDNQAQVKQYNNDEIEFKECVLKVLKNLNTKM
jgi:hypothetical protein